MVENRPCPEVPKGVPLSGVQQVRQPVFAEHTDERGPGLFERDAGVGIAGQQVPAHRVGDQQRIAVRAVPQPELTLVVGRHHLARRAGVIRATRRRRREPRTGRSAAAMNQTGALEDRVDGRARRPSHVRVLILEPPQDLLRPEAPALSLRDDALFDGLRRSRGRGVRPGGPIVQPRFGIGSMLLEPVVDRLPAHAASLGHFAHGDASLHQLHCRNSLIHDGPRS
jgi:hypothetical protein